jgi:trans-aconitate methyltransferase
LFIEQEENMPMSKKFDITRFYDDLANSWDNTRPKYTLEIFEKITSRLDKGKPYSILDFGCGTGLLCRYLSDNLPNARIEGVDVSSRMIEKARRNCPEGSFYVGDILSLNLPHYDIVVSKDVFNHIDKIPEVFSRLNELLNDDGAFIIANREREQTTKETILAALKLLEYQVSEEQYSFTPAEEEIRCFLKTLSGFSDRHVQMIRERLLASGNYYIIYALS